MKIDTIREAAVQRALRKKTSPSATRAQASSKTSDQVFPGFTRAQLRALVIEQIG